MNNLSIQSQRCSARDGFTWSPKVFVRTVWARSPVQWLMTRHSIVRPACLFIRQDVSDALLSPGGFPGSELLVSQVIVLRDGMGANHYLHLVFGRDKVTKGIQPGQGG